MSGEIGEIGRKQYLLCLRVNYLIKQKNYETICIHARDSCWYRNYFDN